MISNYSFRNVNYMHGNSYSFLSYHDKFLHPTLIVIYCFAYCLFFSFHLDTLVPVTTVELGEPATFTCAFPNALISRRSIQWYKQSAGDLLKLIVTRQKSTQPEYAPNFPASRFQVNSDDNLSNLTILRTRQEDEGMYHCAVSEWIIKTVWSGTYLLLKGNLVVYFRSTKVFAHASN